MKTFKKILKQRSIDEVTILNTIYEDEARKNPESAAMYTWKSAESFMQWSRRRSSPIVPGTLSELAEQFGSGLLERYQRCDELIYKGCVEDTSGNYSIVFASKALIRKTLDMEITEIHVDATFRIVPSTPKCYQLLIMHAMSIPIVYVLMERKTSQAYYAVLHFVKVNLLAEFRPSVILTDFETALREMLIRHFPSATAHGCWFHSNQAVWRKCEN
ncbi:uncharacterized protein LOC115034888 [Acyrthosiphon pisum]|uniref:MULE transposase domain-containing protein n=1 Tax=Acyrthosiphon pisum TaxID=7029 RepID=A0A8R2NW13_ACYPI|nr:uncharacterized protein LOC115034888 [Acyrthosiphon pisum]